MRASVEPIRKRDGGGDKCSGERTQATTHDKHGPHVTWCVWVLIDAITAGEKGLGNVDRGGQAGWHGRSDCVDKVASKLFQLVHFFHIAFVHVSQE
jgi:hypothetical protein